MERTEPKILILDDDPAITTLLCEILQQEGYEVIESNSPKDVLFLARQFRPDLLLLDIMMPEVDGYDVCEFFKRDPELKFTRIVVLTAREDHECRVKSYKAGADAFVSKPFDIEELRELIRNHLSSKLALDQTIRELQAQTTMDRIINCYNRKYLEKRIAEEMKRSERHNRSAALVLIQLDNLKQVNVRYGFAFGNEVLKDVVAAVRQELREFDLLGRYQEDSFLILLPDTPVAGARTAASRIQELLTSMIFLKKQRLTLQVTAAATTIHKQEKLEDALQKLADEGLRLKTIDSDKT